MSKIRIRPKNSNEVEAFRVQGKRELLGQQFELVGRAKRASSKHIWIIGMMINGKMTIVGEIEYGIPENLARHLVFAMLERCP